MNTFMNILLHGGNPEEIAVLIPIVVPLAVFTMIVLVRRYEKEERLKMIENGMNPDEFKAAAKGAKYQGGGALKAGTLLMGGGFGLFLAKMIDPYVLGNDPAHYFGLILLFGGLGLIAGHYIYRKQVKADEKGL
ncbi:MAG: hypothetical protein KTR13_10650 [Saprospiraceae bacterium]|nr:hypothetical protein [Saprospiraceae bacterium]